MNEYDEAVRKALIASACTFYVDDGDESYFRYWDDGGLKIRTCHECKTSEFKSPDDGQWILYLTQERMNWICENMGNLECSLCKKWFDRWRQKK